MVLMRNLYFSSAWCKNKKHGKDNNGTPEVIEIEGNTLQSMESEKTLMNIDYV